MDNAIKFYYYEEDGQKVIKAAFRQGDKVTTATARCASEDSYDQAYGELLAKRKLLLKLKRRRLNEVKRELRYRDMLIVELVQAYEKVKEIAINLEDDCGKLQDEIQASFN